MKFCKYPYVAISNNNMIREVEISYSTVTTLAGTDNYSYRNDKRVLLQALEHRLALLT